MAIRTELSIQLSNREYWIKKEIEYTEKLKQFREKRKYLYGSQTNTEYINNQFNYVPVFFGGCLSGGLIGGLISVGRSIHKKLVGDGNIDDNYKNYLNNFNQSYVIRSNSYLTNFKN